jgi:hypothetical protein
VKRTVLTSEEKVNNPVQNHKEYQRTGKIGGRELLIQTVKGLDERFDSVQQRAVPNQEEMH